MTDVERFAIKIICALGVCLNCETDQLIKWQAEADVENGCCGGMPVQGCPEKFTFLSVDL
jgi:hypothetical protein